MDKNNITKKQNEIVTMIYNFNFLNTIQIQKLLQHKKRQRPENNT